MWIRFYKAPINGTLLENLSEIRKAEGNQIQALDRNSVLSVKDVDLHFLIEMGAIYVEQQRALDPQFLITKENLLRIHWSPKRFFSQREPKILFENTDFLICDKPSGIPTHPSLDNYRENLWHWLQKQRSDPLLPIQRLDVLTSGLIAFAKNRTAQKLFQSDSLLAPEQSRKFKKVYTTISLQAPPLGLQSHWMADSARAPKKQAFKEDPKAKLCRLEVLAVERREFAALGPLYQSHIELLTGRTHQIRFQMSQLGCPLIGDEMYGGVPSDYFGLRSIRWVGPGIAVEVDEAVDQEYLKPAF